MPLNKKLLINKFTAVYIWCIIEEEEHLIRNIDLSQTCILRLRSLKSKVHRKGFLSVRHLLRAAGYSSAQLIYDKQGIPSLDDGTKISITHSKDYAGIVLSNTNVGIDIEWVQPKIERVQHKFINKKEQYLLSDNTLNIMTFIWCIKEAAYKASAIAGLRFLEDILITHLDAKKTNARVEVRDDITFQVKLLSWENYCAAITF